jgi:hypothetical protein
MKTYVNFYLEKHGYYQMANSEICDNVLENIKVDYPNAIIIKAGIHQYIVANEQGKNTLKNKLQNELQDYKEKITELEYTLYELDLNEF